MHPISALIGNAHIKGRRARHMRLYGSMGSAAMLWVCVFTTLMATGGATETEVLTRGEGHCARPFDLGRALSNETLHEQVYYWANNHDVREWQWEKTTASPDMLLRLDLSVVDGAKLECVGIRYAAGIRIPEPFESLLVVWHMSVEIPLRVEKVVCRGDAVLYEYATIQEPVLNEIHMITKHDLVTDFALQSSAKTTLVLPWFAAMLEAQVKTAMSRSVGEKFDAVVRSLCEPKGARRSFSFGSLFSSWVSVLLPASSPFGGNTTLKNATSHNSSHKTTQRPRRSFEKLHRPKPQQPQIPQRPEKPVNASETWIVILLPEDEPWPAPCDDPFCDEDSPVDDLNATLFDVLQATVDDLNATLVEHKPPKPTLKSIVASHDAAHRASQAHGRPQLAVRRRPATAKLDVGVHET